MLELFFGVYGLTWWLIFKRLKLLPINLWTVVTSIFILIVVVGFGFIFLGRYQPQTHNARTYAIVTPIVAETSGRVIEVAGKPDGSGLARVRHDGQEAGDHDHDAGSHAQAADTGAVRTLGKGDVLFRVDPVPYQARVDAARATVRLTETRLQQETSLAEQNAGTQIDLDRAKADHDRAVAELITAEHQLEATVVRAPADGYATQIVIREGQYVTPMAFNRVMAFVHDEGPYLVANFRQNAIEHIDPGDEAEVAFDAVPGRVFAAQVRAVQPVIREGVITAGGEVRSFDTVGHHAERIPVLLHITDDLSMYNLPAGSRAMVAVYTGKKHHLNILRKMILRIKSWENWVYVP